MPCDLAFRVAQRSVVFFIAIALLAESGCGSGNGEIAQVSGRVTLNGAPLQNATVTFQPISADGSNPGSGSYGKTDRDGRYSLEFILVDGKGARVGEHRVMITTAGNAGTTLAEKEKAVEIVPKNYWDGSLRFAVPAEGTKSADFELKGRPSS
jgi:hypothetical protein